MIQSVVIWLKYSHLSSRTRETRKNFYNNLLPRLTLLLQERCEHQMFHRFSNECLIYDDVQP